jgi:hypothetical protein
MARTTGYTHLRFTAFALLLSFDDAARVTFYKGGQADFIETYELSDEQVAALNEPNEEHRAGLVNSLMNTEHKLAAQGGHIQHGFRFDLKDWDRGGHVQHVYIDAVAREGPPGGGGTGGGHVQSGYTPQPAGGGWPPGGGHVQSGWPGATKTHKKRKTKPAGGKARRPKRKR